MTADPATIAAQQQESISAAWRREAAAELSRCSWKLRLVSGRVREQFAATFLRVVEVCGTEDAARALFRERIRETAIPLPLIILLAEIAFKVLWYWWTHRR